MKEKTRIVSLLLALCITLGGCAGSDSSAQSVQESTADNSSAVQESSSEEEKEPEFEMLKQKPKQVINEQPLTFETAGADKAAVEKREKELEDKYCIPIISVTTKDEDEIVSTQEYTPCLVDVINCEDKYRLSEASAGIKVRGNSSAFYGDVAQIRKNQVPYRIKFDKKTNMLGLHGGNENKSWVLLKADWDLIRNDIALRFGRAIMKDGTFCSDAQLVYTYVNGQYKGTYLLCEQCQVGKNRVNISEPEENYTGTDFGFYLELDNYATSEEDNIYINVDYGEYEVEDANGETRAFVPAEYSVKNDVYTKEQVEFIEKYLNGVFEIVYQACEKGEYFKFDENYDLVKADFTSAEETVENVMNIDSVVDMYLLYEIVHDYDCGEGSFFMCTDFAEGAQYDKLTFTSPWDFNWAYNDSTKRYWAGGFSAKSFVNQYGDRSNPWFIVLIKQDWFRAKVSAKWTALQKDGAIEGCIKDEKAYLEKYRDDLNRDSEWGVDNAYKLFEWIEKRLKWMDEQFMTE